MILQPSCYHRSQTLLFRCGFPVQRAPLSGVGGVRLVQDLNLENRGEELRNEREDEEDFPKDS